MSGFLCSMAGATYAAAAPAGRAANTLTAQNTAQVDTAQSQFGGASLLLNGSSSANVSTSFAFGTGDFTVEYWVRSATLSGYDIHWDLRGSPTSNVSPIVYTLNGVLTMDVGATTRITGGTLSTNTWYHIALSRSGSSTKLFIDGTQTGSTYTDTNNYVADTTLYIGQSGGNGVDGHMDEFRISNSARYTTTFTPSATQFVNDVNTLLLVHFNGTDASTVFEDDNGAPKGVEFQRSSGERIRVASLGSLPSNSKAWVASAWYKPASLVTSGTHAMFGTTQTIDGNSPIAFEITGSSTINGYGHFLSGAANIDATFTPGFTVGTWYHIVFRLNGTNSGRTQCWVNGVRYLDIAADNYAQNLPHASTADFGMGARSMSTLYTDHCLDGCLAQVWVYAADYDIETNITKFYNNGLVDFGNNGTASGLPSPHFYHKGSTQATFDDINGSVTGTATVTGTLSTCS